MKHEFMNNGEPLASGVHAGKIGIKIDFEDGSQTQGIYGASKEELLDKVLGMYGNTRQRVKELQEPKTPPAPAPQAPKKLTPEERIRLTADLTDPAKSAEAIAALQADATGFDAAEAQRAAERNRVAEELKVFRTEQVRLFMEATPEYHANKRNGGLLRDRALRLAGSSEPTATNYADAYRELADENLLEPAPMGVETPPEPTRTAEPSAPPPQRPTGTGLPPSRTSTGNRPAQPTQRETYEDFLALDPSEFERRLRTEDGFADKVQKAAEARQKA